MSKLAYANPEIVKYYVQTRPSPPPSLANAVMDYLRGTQDKGSMDLKLCLDVGCGSGQNTKLYADHFHQVIGLDISPDQLAAARTINTHHNIVYKEARAEVLPVEDASVDLVTCCESVHWFNIQSFYSEVRRVLRPGGVLACYGYQEPALWYNGKNLNYVINELLKNTWKEVWIQHYSHLDDEYNSLPELYPEHVMIKAAEGKFLVENDETVDEYLTTVFSFPMYQRVRNKYGKEKADQDVKLAKQRLHEGMGSNSKQEQLKVQYSYFLKMWRKQLNDNLRVEVQAIEKSSIKEH